MTKFFARTFSHRRGGRRGAGHLGAAGNLRAAVTRLLPPQVGEKKPLSALRGEREGSTPQAWEGEVGRGERCGIPHLTPPSPPLGAERERRGPAPHPIGPMDAGSQEFFH